MKKTFLKKMMPFAVVVMGISGAFLTTSMQSDSNSAAPRMGYINGAQGACSVSVNCSDIPGQVCRANGTTGTQAFGKDSQNNCVELLYRP
ncbi:DUF6520 family protein [Flavobacterium xanthum]|jgi:hypothetical protein|uniref:Uncharacterized protein n=1 Tax=Flavobacterium xanthum TaxID=69322 RepID=A0A1M7IX64_9FLAO|nr:DUF6520 family protein [Flavobacterium xanthum]SHM44907.1 hypothetical protein SAMN05443669_103714 [Flavobacterium xanthum]